MSFDLEEWYLEKKLHGGRKEKFKAFEVALERLLLDLENLNIKATFFCLGKMASEYPAIVKILVKNGHDIGCHSDKHNFMTAMSPDELRQDTINAIHALEDVSGKKVTSYRAPAFSITPKNSWAIEVLGECGIEIDSSIFPAARALGGYPTFGGDMPCRVSHKGVILKEFPVTIMSFLGKKMAFSGGGYFRLLPYWTVKHEIKKHDYNICYFHLLDLISEDKKLTTKKQFEEYFNMPGTFKNRAVRYIKNNIGSNDAFGKLEKMIAEFDFISVCDAERMIDWDMTRIVEV